MIKEKKKIKKETKVDFPIKAKEIKKKIFIGNTKKYARIIKRKTKKS